MAKKKKKEYEVTFYIRTESSSLKHRLKAMMKAVGDEDKVGFHSARTFSKKEWRWKYKEITL
jgi:hypothetical protein